MSYSNRTAEGRHQIAQNAGKLHPWPDEVGECSADAHVVFVKLQKYRAYDDWTPFDVVELARLAKMTVDAVDLQARLDDEGYILTNEQTGATKINPVHGVLTSQNGNINSLARRLSLTTALTQAESRKQATKALLARQAEETYGETNGDNLLN